MASSTRFSALPFAYNARVALALAPPLAATLASSGPSGAVLAGGGCVLAYLLDVSRAPEATLVTLWATLGAVYVCLTFGDVTLHTGGMTAVGPVPALAHIALVCLQGQTLFFAGVWATLQVRPVSCYMTALLLNSPCALLAAVSHTSPFLLAPVRSSSSCSCVRPASCSPASASSWLRLR